MAIDRNHPSLSKGNAKWQVAILLMGPFAAIGRGASRWVRNLGAGSIFLLLAFLMIFRPKQLPKIVQQIYYIGASSTMITNLPARMSSVACGIATIPILSPIAASLP